MILSIVPAMERLSRLEFQADRDWDTYPSSVYHCPVCGTQTSFAMRDLDRHAHREFTNLSQADARVVAEVVEGSGREYNSFLDFYCPGCRVPVRIYYSSWAGGRWTRGHDLLFIVESTAVQPVDAGDEVTP